MMDKREEIGTEEESTGELCASELPREDIVPETLWSRITPRIVRGWKGAAKFGSGVEAIAKPVTYTVALLGLLVVYFPHLRTGYEILVMPKAWYQVGEIARREKPGLGEHDFQLVEHDYDSPAWDDRLNWHKLLGLAGTFVRTTGSSVGRTEIGTDKDIQTVLGADQCLYVRDLAFSGWTPSGEAAAPQKLSSMNAASELDQQKAIISEQGGGMSTKGCQVPTAREWQDRRSDKIHVDYDSTIPVCRRVIVWIQAQKLTC